MTTIKRLVLWKALYKEAKSNGRRLQVTIAIPTMFDFEDNYYEKKVRLNMKKERLEDDVFESCTSDISCFTILAMEYI